VTPQPSSGTPVRSLHYDYAAATLVVEFDDKARSTITFHGQLLAEPETPRTDEALGWQLSMAATPQGPSQRWGSLRITRPDEDRWPYDPTLEGL